MAGPASALFLAPLVVHRLGIAIQFVDHFTALPVRIPLDVAIESLRWRAFRSENDSTYRFLRTNGNVPSGNFTVTVRCPTGEYENREPVVVTLPIVVAHPPPFLPTDYLLQAPLWPTRRLRPEPGETVVTGRVLQTGPPQIPAPGLRVRLFGPATPPPGTPYAYTNVEGEFVYRLSGLRMAVVGGVLVDTAPLNVTVRNAAETVGFTPTPGSISVRLGQQNEVLIQIP